MYESTFETVTSSFQPLIELAELNRKTLEKITSVQTSYLTDCISSSLKQVKTLAESGSPQRATELAFEISKEFENKFNGATEQNLAALTELRAAYSALVNGSCSGSYARIIELCTPKEGFATTLPAVFNIATGIAQQSVNTAPSKPATVKKTPAKAAVIAAPTPPVIAEKPAVAAATAAVVTPVVAIETDPAVEVKSTAAVVEIQPTAATEATAEVKTEVKTAVKNSEAVTPAPVAGAKKTPIKRAAAKPAMKKYTSKTTAKKY